MTDVDPMTLLKNETDNINSYHWL